MRHISAKAAAVHESSTLAVSDLANRLRAQGKLYAGRGISTDIIGARIRAYLNALNKIVFEEG